MDNKTKSTKLMLAYICAALYVNGGSGLRQPRAGTELGGVELCDDGLEDLVADRQQHTLVVVLARFWLVG
jgi:hypothetical protein